MFLADGPVCAGESVFLFSLLSLPIPLIFNSKQGKLSCVNFLPGDRFPFSGKLASGDCLLFTVVPLGPYASLGKAIVAVTLRRISDAEHTFSLRAVWSRKLLHYGMWVVSRNGYNRKHLFLLFIQGLLFYICRLANPRCLPKLSHRFNIELHIG